MPYLLYMAFSIAKRLQDGWQMVELQDDRFDSCVSIIPMAGAILNSWKFATSDGSVDIIEGYIGREDFEKNVHNGFKSAKLSPFVCRLKDGKFKWEGRELTLQKFMLNKESIHGILYDAPFTVTSISQDSEHCSVELAYEYSGSFAGFPFPYNITVRYTLLPDNVLVITSVISNMADGPMPIADGWHPYYKIGGKVDNWQLQVATDQMLEYDEGLLPTGRLVFNDQFMDDEKIGSMKLDNGFLLKEKSSPLCTLKNPANNISIAFLSQQNYPYLQLYIPEHRESIAIENLSSAPDAFNNGMGLLNLQPGEEVTFEVTIKASAG